MNDKCKCKNLDEYKVIEGIGIRCEKCLKWIHKFRKTFHKLTNVKEDKTKYDRNKEKRKLRKRIKEE